MLKIDGATAMIDFVGTDPEHRGRGHGDALIAAAFAIAGDAGCDLIVLDADIDDWPRRWYGRLGFDEIALLWSATRV
jgi:ribosomal protein S18 acetylase RimI-like enzyme